MRFIFWFCLLCIIYVYIVYPILVYAVGKIMQKKTAVDKKEIWPNVTIIFAAYNEEGVIRESINNKLSLDYPPDKLEILVVSDASTDKTEEIVGSFSKDRVRLVVMKERSGRLAALNMAAPMAKGDILIITDANAFFKKDNIEMLVRNFNDPGVVCVDGEKRMYRSQGMVGIGEDLYWRYESFIKKYEAKTGSTIIVDGNNLAIRREVYSFPYQKGIGSDYVMAFELLSRGYPIIYEAEAIAFESPSLTMKEEFLRKDRIICSGWRAVAKMSNAWNPFSKKGSFLKFWKIFSHKVLRWLVPYFLFIVLITNILLVHVPFYKNLFYIQILFYLFGIAGFILQMLRIRIKLFYAFYYLFFANFAALIGHLRFLFGKKVDIWEHPQR